MLQLWLRAPFENHRSKYGNWEGSQKKGRSRSHTLQPHTVVEYRRRAVQGKNVKWIQITQFSSELRILCLQRPLSPTNSIWTVPNHTFTTLSQAGFRKKVSWVSKSFLVYLQIIHEQNWINHYPCFQTQFSSVQLLSCVQLFATPWIAARQASLSITNSQSSLRLTSIESVMPSSHLILCRPLLPMPPIPPRIRVFSNESTLHMR